MDCIWYSGLYICTPRVGSWQTSQNKLIWFTLLCYLLLSGHKKINLGRQLAGVQHLNVNTYLV